MRSVMVVIVGSLLLGAFLCAFGVTEVGPWTGGSWGTLPSSRDVPVPRVPGANEKVTASTELAVERLKDGRLSVHVAGDTSRVVFVTPPVPGNVSGNDTATYVVAGNAPFSWETPTRRAYVRLVCAVKGCSVAEARRMLVEKLNDGVPR